MTDDLEHAKRALQALEEAGFDVTKYDVSSYPEEYDDSDLNVVLEPEG